MKIDFNRPFLTGNETKYIKEAVARLKLSGNGHFTQCCHRLLENRYQFKKTLLTTSCTDALEMSAILADVKPGDEVIVPSYTFVSTANAFALRGAKIIFADSDARSPNIEVSRIAELVSSKTKVIVIVHYGGIACDMDPILALARGKRCFLVEDCAHAIDSYYRGHVLGTLGNFATFSFHETKNIICGEGGMLSINDSDFHERAEIIWEKGTNRSAFNRGEVAKYNWIDIGSSFLPSEITAAFLFAQLESLELIQKRRVESWNKYFSGLHELECAGLLQLPYVPDYATINGHLFYVIAQSQKDREDLRAHLLSKGIGALFHYLPLHESPFFKDKHDGREMPNSIRFSNCLLRLPLFYEITDLDINYIIDTITSFFRK